MLLAILALAAPRPMGRARLAELLWSRRLEEQARASLRQEIHRLLEALQPIGAEIVRVTRDQLQLRSELVWSDVDQVSRATAADPSPLALLEGVLLEDFTGIDAVLDGWLANERERLRERARGVADDLLREHVAPDTAIFVAQRLLTLDRAHEGAWQALIRAYSARGERGLAIQTYERCRTNLAEMLGAAPSADTIRLVADLRADRAPPESAVWAAAQTKREPRPTPSSAAKIGVLPLLMLSHGEEESQLVAGLAEELTASLARFRWMAVVSAASLAQSGTRDEGLLSEQFGLDFLLSGSVHRVSHQLRINVQLTDVRAGNQIVWARRFDHQVSDIMSLQDEVASEIVAQIDPEVMLAESRRANQRPTVEPSAYDLVLRALPLMGRLRHDEFTEAGLLLSRALTLEPEYAAAHSWRAYWLAFCIGQGWAHRPAEAASEAGSTAERAIMLDPQDARSFTIAGHVRSFLHHRPREALELHARAVSLNPNLPMAWGYSAINYLYLGDLPEAGRRFARYKRLAALDTGAFFYEAGMAMMEILNRDYDAAIILGRRSTELSPAFVSGLKHYLCALGHAGAETEADHVRGRLLALQPAFSVQAFLAHNSFAQPADAEHYAAGLRRAGLPEAAAKQSF